MSELQVLTVPEAAQWLRISRSKLYALIASGQVPALRIGRNVRLLVPDLEQWLTQCRVEGTADPEN